VTFKKTQKNPLAGGFFWVFLGGFFWVFLGGFFWAGLLMPTLFFCKSDSADATLALSLTALMPH